MASGKHNVAGATANERKLWNTYLYLARSAFPESITASLTIASPAARIPAKRQACLGAIVFATSALEYRLRSTYAALGLKSRPRDGAWDLLSSLDRRAASVRGLDGRRITFPAEWRSVRRRLQRLLQLRNDIVHGDEVSVRALLTQRSPSIQVQARRGYNAIIDAVRIINVAIGYEQLRGAALRAHYSALKVRRITGGA